jgi:DNA repair protein RecN (Recombination protein N)
MLLELTINDFAIIEHCSVQFDRGFVAMTGETGAGKSIIVDALGAALGGKVGAEVVRAGAKGATVEAIFALDENLQTVKEFLAERELESGEDVLILRREISATGRSMSRINGRAVPTAVLATLGAHLADIHGQSEHLSLLRSERQLEMLDRYAGLQELRERFQREARVVTSVRRELAELLASQREAERRIDLLRFQVDEIERANLCRGEEEELINERRLLSNAERLTELATNAFEALHGNSDLPGAVDLLAAAAQALTELARIDPSFEATTELCHSLHYQAEDIAMTVRRYRDNVEYDPARLNEIEERLDLLARLKRKYGDTIEEILAFYEHARTDLENIEGFDERVTELRTALQEAEAKAAVDAATLSQARRDHAERFTAEVQAQLELLGLGKTRFEVQFEHRPDEEGLEVDLGDERGRFAFSSTGIDRVTFLVSFNPGEPLRPIEKVASGGETARFMLALKTVLSAADDIPTLVFDEIDTGVGGRSGQVVGAMLRGLAHKHQVISITHLPQIAAQASQHLKILKVQSAERTTVQVEELEGSTRVQELAEMLAGAQPSETARRSAEELLAMIRP